MGFYCAFLRSHWHSVWPAAGPSTVIGPNALTGGGKVIAPLWPPAYTIIPAIASLDLLNDDNLCFHRARCPGPPMHRIVPPPRFGGPPHIAIGGHVTCDGVCVFDVDGVQASLRFDETFQELLLSGFFFNDTFTGKDSNVPKWYLINIIVRWISFFLIKLRFN